MRYAEHMKWTKIRGGKTAKGKYMMSLYLFGSLKAYYIFIR
jgi:hypothetical protein